MIMNSLVGSFTAEPHFALTRILDRYRALQFRQVPTVCSRD